MPLKWYVNMIETHGAQYIPERGKRREINLNFNYVFLMYESSLLIPFTDSFA